MILLREERDGVTSIKDAYQWMPWDWLMGGMNNLDHECKISRMIFLIWTEFVIARLHSSFGVYHRVNWVRTRLGITVPFILIPGVDRRVMMCHAVQTLIAKCVLDRTTGRVRRHSGFVKDNFFFMLENLVYSWGGINVGGLLYHC